jgi:hypothetical protein
MKHVNLNSIFGEATASHLHVLSLLLDGIGSHQYAFMSAAQFDKVLKTDLREAMRIYWLEILYRAHFAACAALVRTNRWVSATLEQAQARNYTAFCAAYRGCLEASADCFHTFQSIPTMIADMHVVIRKAVVGEADRFVLFKKLEDELIHFTHARYVAKGEEVDEAHRAKVTKQYLDSLLGEAIPEGVECYRTLCDVTHPGIGSVRCYADGFKTETGAGYRFTSDQDELLISTFCEEYKRVSGRMIFAGVVPPAVALRILNEFPTRELHTPSVMRINIDNQPFWKQFSDQLKDPRLPEERGMETMRLPGGVPK